MKLTERQRSFVKYYIRQPIFWQEPMVKFRKWYLENQTKIEQVGIEFPNLDREEASELISMIFKVFDNKNTEEDFVNLDTEITKLLIKSQ